GDAVRVAYLLCRAADALEDSWPGTAGAIERRFDRLCAAVEGDDEAARELGAGAASRPGVGGDDLELVANLPRVMGAFGALAPGGAGDRRPSRVPGPRRPGPRPRLPRHHPGPSRALPALLPVARAVGARLAPSRPARPRVPMGPQAPAPAASRALAGGAGLAL